MNRARDRYGAALALLAILLGGAPVVAQPTPHVAQLRVGTSGDYPPFSFRRPSAEVTGFDIVVAERLARDLERGLQVVPFRWPDLVSQLRAGAFDIAMSGVTVRPERAVFVNFTRPYAVSGAVAVIRAEDREKFAAVSDLDMSRVRIAANRGGHLEQVARQRFPRAQLTLVDDNTTLPMLLVRGEVDAAISEEFEARTWTAAAFITLGPFTRDRKAYALRRDAGDLLRQVNDWLAAREADGWLNEQRRHWLGERAVYTPEQAGFEALVAAIDLRLQLMPLVGAVKRRENLPIDDPAQEARVLERVRVTAAAAGLRPDAVVELFRIQMKAAKAVEHAAPAASIPAALPLADLRAAIAAASDLVVTELGRCQPWLMEPRQYEQFATLLTTGISAPAAQPFTAPLLDTLRRVRPLSGRPAPEN